MALKIITIVGSLVVLSAALIKAKGNLDKDVQIQSSDLDQVSNADLHVAHIRSRVLRSAGKQKTNEIEGNNLKPKPGRKGKKGKKNHNNRVKGKSKKKKRSKKTNQENPPKKSTNKNKKKHKKNNKGKSGKERNMSGKKHKCKKGKRECKRKGKKIISSGKKKHKKSKTKKNNNGKSNKEMNINGKGRKCKKGKGKCTRNGKKIKSTGKKCKNGDCKRDKNDKKNDKKVKKGRKNKKMKKIFKKKTKEIKVVVRADVCKDCVVKLANYAKLYVAQAKNRKQQILRMEAACKTSKKKVAKKGLFDDPFQKLLANAGGNKSDPKCRGKSIGMSRGSNDTQAADGAASVADLTILEACNKTIEVNCSSCQLDDPKVEKMAQDCKTAMVSFIGKMDNCLNVSKYGNQAALCPCIDGIDDANKTLENQIRACKWVTDASAQEVKNKKSCVGEFAKCRKAEDATVGHIHKCKLPLLKCGGVTTVAEAKTDLPILKNLKTELDATEDKMKKGFTNNNLAALNTANDSKTPSGLSDFIKNPSGGSRAASKCRQLAQAFLKFNQSAVGTGESANSDLNGTEASNTTDILKVMKNRDFDSEVANCQTTGKQQTTLYLIVRFYGATMILWRTTVVDVKILVLQLVISNAAAEDDTATTAAAGATTAAAGATTATAAAGATTAAAGATTAAAGATTAAAGATTAAAGATTAAAGATTAAAGATTAAAEATTTVADATTAAAADTTAPVVVTARAQGRKKKFLESMQWLKQKVLKA